LLTIRSVYGGEGNIMINHFNAFISYKHADLDNKIAASIVRDLEHFHIPKKIQKATGVKKIERIFRDKDELPITSDLNDTISMALHNADYLIVICSTNTKYSTWVEKEIEVFLQNHSMNQILTVLADGEPYEVIPKVLLTGKKEVVDEDGVARTVEMPFEPLSCDYRLPYRRAKAEELPRMAAAIIGCSYDELINRRRQYKMRRLTAITTGIMALSVGFAGYMFYSNTLIQKNYLESLKNQSRNLANQSSQLLEDDRCLDAMQLALEALPKDENDKRPVTPEAIKAITLASRAYESVTGSNVQAVWNYKMPNHVTEFRLSPQATYLVGQDLSGVVIGWDTKTHKQVLYQDNYGDDTQKFFFYGEDRLLILCSHKLSAYDLVTGREIWTLRDKDYDIIYTQEIFPYEDETILLVGSRGNVDVVSMQNGRVKDSFMIDDVESREGYSFLTNFAISEDKKHIACVLEDCGDFSSEDYYLLEYDIETGTLSMKEDVISDGVASIKYVGDKIFIACNDEGLDGSVKGYGFHYITENKVFIKCISSGDLSLLWDSEFIYSDVPEKTDFLALSDDKVAFYKADTCEVWNVETGEVQGVYGVNDIIVDVSDVDRNGVPMFITNKGATGTPADTDGYTAVSLITRFQDNIVNACVGNGVYTCGYLSSEIIFYNSNIYDEEWIPIEDVPVFSTSADFYMDENVLAIVDKENEGAKAILIDPKDKKVIGEVSLGDSILASKYRILGSFEDKLYLALCDNRCFEIITIDLATLKTEHEVINDDFSGFDPVCAMDGGNLVYYDMVRFEQYYVVRRNLATGEETRVDFEGDINNLFYFADQDRAYLVADQSYSLSIKTDFLINFADGSVTEIEIPEDWGKTTLCTMDEKGEKLAITNNVSVKLIGTGNENLGEVSCHNVYPLAMSFFEEDGENLLLVAYEDGTFYRYDAKDLQFVGKSDLSVYSTITTKDYSFIDYDPASGYLYVQCGSLVDIIETNTWIELTRVVSCFGHEKATDTFLTASYEGSSNEATAGYFRHYTVDDLIRKTRDYLQGEEMSEDQKSMYGIDG
jgi:WD40 repeat protein